MGHSFNRASIHQEHTALEIAKGEIEGYSYVQKFGRNITVASGTQEVIWDGSTAVYTYEGSAVTLYVSSSHTDDDEIIEVQGLDANWQLQTVEVTVNGFVSVALSGTWMRVFRAKNISATSPEGIIYISTDDDAGGDGIPDVATGIKAQILVGNNQTNMAIYTIPAGHTGYLVGWYASMLRATGVTATGADLDILRKDFGGVFRSTQPVGIQNTGTGIHNFTFPFPLTLNAKSDIEVVAQPTAGADVAAGFTILLIRD